MKSHSNGLRKHYHALTLHERVSAIFSAFGRGDSEELNALTASAPRVRLEAPDCGRQVHRLLWVAGIHRSNQLAGLALFHMLLHWEREQEVATMLREVLTVTLGRQQAFEDFCIEHAIDAAALTKHLDGGEALEVARRVWESTKGPIPPADAVARAEWYEFLNLVSNDDRQQISKP